MDRRIACLMAVLAFGWGGAASADTDPRQGAAFGDPSRVLPMPDAWQRQPLRYDRWAAEADIAVTLDQHLYPALLPLIRQYADEHRLRIAVQEGTCGISAGALQRKQVDIGGFCCPPGDVDRLPGLRYHTLGIATLGLLVASDNPLTGVTLAQARDLFAGSIHRWSEVGGPEWPVHAVTRLHCKDRPGHWRLLLDHEDLFGSQVTEVGTIPDMMSRIAGDRSAIGYEVLWNITLHKVGDRVRPLTIDGVRADDEAALAAGRYPLYRAYNISSWDGASPEVQALVRHLRENSATALARVGIVPAAQLRRAGWRFMGDELAAGPH